MSALLAMVLAQAIGGQPTLAPNVWPIDARDEGARLSRHRAYALDCRGAGITCTSDGGVLVATVSGGGGGSTPTVTCAADQALSWDGAAWSCVSKVSAAFAADASVTAQTATALAADPAACSAGTYASDISAAGVLTCGTPAGTYVLPDATNLVTGGIRLTTDLGGTATAPTVVDDSHAHTGTTISALDTGDITTGTLAGARGGLGAAQATCSAGDFLTCNGTTCSCATPSGSGGGYSTVQDEGTGLTARTTINFTGAGVSCVDNGGATRTDCTITGGGGGNVGIATVTFGDGAYSTNDSATATVTAAWVTATSSITFSPACSQVTGSTTAQECFLVMPECAVTSITASTSFDVTCWSEVGGFGSYPISYSGT